MTLNEIISNIEAKFPNHTIIGDLYNQINLSYWIEMMYDKSSELYDACLAKKLMFIALKNVDDSAELLRLYDIKSNDSCVDCDSNCNKKIEFEIVDKTLNLLADE